MFNRASARSCGAAEMLHSTLRLSGGALVGQTKPGKNLSTKTETEQQVEKRLAEDLKRALATKSSRHGNEFKRDKVVGK